MLLCVGQPLHHARGQEVKGLRAALKQRTQQTSQLEAENARLQQLEGQARTQLADQLAGLTGESHKMAISHAVQTGCGSFQETSVARVSLNI